MGFFSRSRSKGRYPNQNHGGEYYKRPNGSGGILGKIFDAITGSKRNSRSYSNHNEGHNSNHNNGGQFQDRHRRKSSWS